MRLGSAVLLASGMFLGAAVSLAPGRASATTASFGPGSAPLLYGNAVEIGDVDGSTDPAPEIVSGNLGFGSVSHLHVLRNDGAVIPDFDPISLSGSASALALGRFLPGTADQILAATGSSILLYRGTNPTPTTLSSAHGAISLDYFYSVDPYLYYTTGPAAGYLRYNGASISDLTIVSGGSSESYRAIKVKPNVIAYGGMAIITGSGGTFSSPSGVASAGSGRDVDYGDVDGDGIYDVLIAKENQLVWVRCVSEMGSCSGGDRAVSAVETFLNWVDLEAQDVDSDGDVDVVAVWRPSGPGPYLCWGETSWFESTGGATPTFTEHPVGCAREPELEPRQVAAGDLDGDGDIDLAFTGGNALSPGFGSTSYRLNQLAFWLTEGYTRKGLGRKVLGHADFNRDGWPDALIASHCDYSIQGGCPMIAPYRDEVELYLGTSTGLAATRAWVAYGAQEWENFGQAIATGDWNADGFVDLAIGSPTYKGGCTSSGERVGRTYLWYGGPADAGNLSGLGVDGSPTNADVILAPTAVNELCYEFPQDGVGADLATGDRNGDGIDDLALSEPGRFHDECGPSTTLPSRGRIRVYRGGTTGPALLETIDGPTCPPAQCAAGQCGGNAIQRPIALGNIDGDARADLVMSRWSSSASDVVRVSFGSGTSQDVSADSVRDLALADVNADGFADVAASKGSSASLWLGGAGGLTPTGWTASFPVDGSGVTRLSSAGQANADCYEDLALAAPTAGNVRVFRGQAGATGPASSPVETIPTSWQSIALAGDARRDGMDDLLAGSAAESRYDLQTGTNAGGVATLYQGEAGVPAGSIPDCDADGSRRNLDCDDRRASVFPGAIEVCNLRDDDCDNQVDEGLACNFADSDGDGIFDDGNHSGVVGDARCTGGATQNCDDNCASTANASQADADADSRGDSCDNCPALANADQADGDADAVGTVCDSCTTVANARVAAGFVSSNPWATLTGGQRDDDHDGYGNRCDAKFPGVAGALVGSGDLTQFRASNGKSRETDTCGSTGTRPCAIFDLDESALLIGTPDLTVFRALNGKAPGPKCPTCPLTCEAGASGTCGAIP